MPAEALTHLATINYEGCSPPEKLVREVPALGEVRARRARVAHVVVKLFSKLHTTDGIGLLVHTAVLRFAYNGVPLAWIQDIIRAGMQDADALLERIAKSRGFEA
jgi:hypothetical protein